MRLQHLVEFIKQRQGQCGIVYARLRATCDWLGTALGSCDLDVGVYHAGKDAARRRKVRLVPLLHSVINSCIVTPVAVSHEGHQAGHPLMSQERLLTRRLVLASAHDTLLRAAA